MEREAAGKILEDRPTRLGDYLDGGAEGMKTARNSLGSGFGFVSREHRGSGFGETSQ